MFITQGAIYINVEFSYHTALGHKDGCLSKLVLKLKQAVCTYMY